VPRQACCKVPLRAFRIVPELAMRRAIGSRETCLEGKPMLIHQPLRAPGRHVTDDLVVAVLNTARNNVTLGFSKPRFSNSPGLPTLTSGADRGTGCAYYWSHKNGQCMLVVRSKRGDRLRIDDAVEIDILDVGASGAKLHATPQAAQRVANVA
jgi:sRNA-binding carbon storage regulator CsrA